MRNAIVMAGIIGAAVLAHRYRTRKAEQAVPAPANESSPRSAGVFLSGGSSPDVVMGADQGYGPLRSAWG